MQLYEPIQLQGNFSYQETLPSRELLDKVVCFWQIDTQEDAVYPVIPDACVDIVINCSSLWSAFFSPSVISPDSFPLGVKQTWFGIRFYPAVLSFLWKINLSELKHQTFDLDSIQKKWNYELILRLQDAHTFEQRTQTTNDFLMQYKVFDLQKDQRLAKLIQEIFYSQGRILLEKNSELGFSPRHLRRLFQQHIGLSPKKFARIVRTQHFLKSFHQNLQTGLFYEHYFDQAHFIKEMKIMTGFTPSQLRSQLP